MSSSFFIWAHRGASGRAPENTLAAFQAALEDGADGVELDIHLSRDGIPVVIHDETLDRTTNGRGPVAAQTLTALRRLDAGAWFGPEFAEERLPTLAEVLDWAGRRLRINIEIKSAAAGQAVLDLLEAFPSARVPVSSFDHRLLAGLRRSAPGLPLGFLSDSRFWHRALRRAVAADAESFHPRHDRLSRHLLAACRRQGLKIFPWTVDSPQEALAFRERGVSGLFTNHPLRMQRLREG